MLKMLLDPMGGIVITNGTSLDLHISYFRIAIQAVRVHCSPLLFPLGIAAFGYI